MNSYDFNENFYICVNKCMSAFEDIYLGYILCQLAAFSHKFPKYSIINCKFLVVNNTMF